MITKMEVEIERAELDEILFKALTAVYRFERVKVARFGLSYEGIYLLQYLRRNDRVSMSEIAEEMNCPVSTATRIVDRLQKKGFVSRVRDTQDFRVHRLALEPAGEAIVSDLEEHSYQVLSKNLKKYSFQDFEGFVKTVMQLENLLDTKSRQKTD